MGWWSERCTATLLVLLFLTALTPSVVADEGIDEGTDDPVTEHQLQADEPQVINVSVDGNRSAILAWRCEACEVILEDAPDGVQVDVHGNRMMSLETEENAHLQLTVRSDVSETMTLMHRSNVQDVQVSNRPSPDAPANLTVVGVCAVVSECIAPSSGHLGTVVNTSDSSYVQTGVAVSSNDHHIVIEVMRGDTLEWQWLASTHTVSVEFYHQTTVVETVLNGAHTSAEAHAEFGDVSLQPGYWVAPDDGRFIARLSTEAVRAVWAANLVLHPSQESSPLVGFDTVQGAQIVGHNSIAAPFDWSELQQLTLTAHVEDVHVSVDQLLNGAWVTGVPTVLEAGQDQIVYPYPDVERGRLNINNTPVYAVDASVRSFEDLDGLEAPSYRPANLDEDNASWPVLNLTQSTDGEFTLAVHDTTDTYRLVVDGWADSIHFVQVVLTGDVAGLELQLWDIDQLTGEVIGTDITRPVGDQLKISLQIGRGTHYLQLRYQNASEATPHLWGEHVSSRTYTLQASYSLIDEGEEPWFPPSDDAVYWGNVARWFMGVLFLLPVVYLGVHVKRSKNFAASVAEKKQRLAWYAARLDSGESSVKETRSDLAKSLRAVAQLAWQEGLDAWGPKRLEHRTEDVALAVWSVDERLATEDGGWPVVVGVHVLNGTWDLAALRFDAPDGEAFEVVHLEPRFLFQGEEVFLDTMGPGHRTYLMAELKGSAQRVDVELNGRMDGAPFAARVPETLERA
tara:strand:- start:522 stop:2735 length:2214 start_codon:yes stop_codon:yes gene_type:complete